MDNPPIGYSRKDVSKMSDDELLDMDYFLNEDLEDIFGIPSSNSCILEGVQFKCKNCGCTEYIPILVLCIQLITKAPEVLFTNLMINSYTYISNQLYVPFMVRSLIQQQKDVCCWIFAISYNLKISLEFISKLKASIWTFLQTFIQSFLFLIGHTYLTNLFFEFSRQCRKNIPDAFGIFSFAEIIGKNLLCRCHLHFFY